MSDEKEKQEQEEEKLVLAAVTAVVKAIVSTAALLPSTTTQQKRKYKCIRRIPGSITISKKRRNLNILFSELTAIQYRRMYRMHKESFTELVDTLDPKLTDLEPRKRGKDVNGPITKETRLAMALRWFAGGSKYDIACNHGVGACKVFVSVWIVVDSIHSTALDITFPTNHVEK